MLRSRGSSFSLALGKGSPVRALVRGRQETCQTASAGGCLQHVQEGTRNRLMINHCQPLFSLKAGLSDKAGNEALFWACCYVVVQGLEPIPAPCKAQLPLCPVLTGLGGKVVVRVPASGYRAVRLSRKQPPPAWGLRRDGK